MTEPGHPSKIRFGVYELDLQSGELYKGRTRIRLQDQPLRVLIALLNKPGEVVSREELRQELWPSDTFVDFEHGLRAAVNKLRQALSDDPEKPRYVETLPRRGYRFIFPVQQSQDRLPPGSGLETGQISTGIAADAPGGDAGEAPGIRRKSGRVVWWSSLLTIIAFALFLGIALRRPTKLAEKDTVVLAEFANSTGEPVFDRTLRRGLGIALEQSPFVRILSDNEVEKTLGYMKRAANTPLTPEIAHEVCKRTSSAAVLDGAIDRVGSRYVVALKASNCQSGRLLGETEFRAADKDGVLDALGKASSEIRHQLGESIASVEKSDKPLAEASTSSIDALQAYTLWNYEDDDDAAMSLLRRATTLDPHFALAYLQMADMCAGRGEADGAISNLKKAFEFRTQASDWERLIIESRYEENVTGDIERAHELYELRARLYPADPSGREGAGGIYAMLGQYELALAPYRESAKINPNKVGTDAAAALLAILANRLEEARSFNSLAIRKESNDPGNTYLLAFLDDDVAAMQKSVKESEGTGFEEQTVSMDSDSEARIGHLKRADELSTHVVALCQKKSRLEEAAEYQLDAALRNAEFGKSRESTTLAERSLRLAPTRDVKILAAIALARAGHTQEAERLADEVDKLNPQNTQIQRYWLPTARAAIHLSRKEPQKAIEILRNTADLDLGLIYPTIEVNGLLYPVFLRGEALLLLNRGKEAVLDFQKFSDHRTIVLNNPLGALAKLQMGRAYAMQGDATRSRAAYEDFLNLWKDADPDIPIFQQAITEFAKLN